LVKYFFAAFITSGALFLSLHGKDPERAFAISTNVVVIFYFTTAIIQGTENKNEQK
jgi:hypothetical protein